MKKSILFIQPFGLNDPGGGAKILRSLLKDAPFEAVVVSSSIKKPNPTQIAEQHWIPFRPKIPLIENTRFSKYIKLLDPIFIFLWKIKFQKFVKQRSIDAVHIIPHEQYDFWIVYKWAKRKSLPLYLQVHDDFRYNSKQISKVVLRRMQEVWLYARTRFVISNEMGKEYCQRYGNESYHIITDGIRNVEVITNPLIKDQLKIYFSGLFHYDYISNFRNLTEAIQKIEDYRITLVLRGCTIPSSINIDDVQVNYLPFAQDSEVAKDVKLVNLLYLPLPFNENKARFNKFSLSTKLILYLSFGLPIIYHGPRETALYNLLKEYNAAIFITDNNPYVIADTIKKLDSRKISQVTHNMRELTQQKFVLNDIRSSFFSQLDK